MRTLRILLWPAAFAVGLVAESVFYGFGDPSGWIPDLVTGWTLMGCGLVAWNRRPESRVGTLIFASGLCWFLGNFAASGVGVAAWAGRHEIYLHRGPLLHAILTYPSGRTRSRTQRIAIAGGYAAAIFEPVWADERLAILLGVLLVGLAVGLRARSIAQERRARLLAVWVAFVVGLAIVGGAATRLAFSLDTAKDVWRLAYQAALMMSALAMAGGVVSRFWDRAAVTDLVVEMGEERSDRLREGLARALGDPGLEVGYWSPETEEYVDSSGRPLSLPGSGSDRLSTMIDNASGAIGVLVHHRSVLDDPVLADSIATATRLAAVNARLQAEVRAQIGELEASRRRIVTAGDEEHRRLERRLRDGAEQRLHDLAGRLRLARRDVESEPAGESLDNVVARLAEVLEEVRALAAGLHPRLLTESGLAGALEALAARSTTAVHISVTAGRLPAGLEAAVYFICSEALANVDKHAAAASATVVVSTTEHCVRIEVSDDGGGGADPAAGSGLLNLIDRVQALGGTLDIVSPPSRGTQLVAELPVDAIAPT